MLNATDLKNGAVFKEDNQIFQVVNYEHIKMGRGSGTIKVKVRNLKTGSTTEKSFITGARVQEANVEKKKAQFLYRDGETFNFMDPTSFEQFPLSDSVVGEQAKFLKDGLEVTLIVSEGEGLGLELPNSLVYEISDTGPGERGNTVSNVFKDATLDNGLIIKVPMFAKIGEKIKVDTRTGQYVERVK
ncbi:elongation factor P [Candidatus Daviesbacteria bacterium RIFCSPLOWO2_01_FULL_43_38]|uniref:Elongation factor P n=3 Tax=Candidatus Daviesiibacteriota TaxID=1752718 RepID=A0A1F5K2Z1_9BACT|nr:MAG: Elongation factor P [Candidatus Daviesbacteria bacterium GW2011_GWA1_42_6]KKS70402.1 MAG: Elongation factor P [Candidatus Daviesbacteria bacterium GW2011_GWA2_42_7]OGE20535.1 MAG: elongation factor P [Candidatus Daviesbacteria bacterium RIFCSPHIGHO2_01_FULL_43_17]OGE35091.1 MAG: elongation factor P [Candidatus Daviesbacteria bacterium RIFCSPHIGHO2_12_FULL_43_11]OGE63731.1 MAG: elongation factor P [Candidatus Daviesbacteria bacterium RIFCSPLOWO2_01_FULL_43_38]OGE70537.1 MAG: elongation 